MPRSHGRFLLAGWLVLAACAVAWSQTPLGPSFTIQGRVTDGGAIPSATSADFQFTLWDAAGTGAPPVGGTQIGGMSNVTNAALTNGLFSVIVNSGNEFGATAFAGDSRWVQIAVRAPTGSGGFVILSPRQPLTAAPYATYAPGAGNAAQLNGQAASFYRNAGNLNAGTLPTARLSGAYSSALTLSNAANVFTGNGAALSSLNASNLASGTVPDGRISGTYTGAITLNNPANAFTGDGSGLTNLNATNLTSGTLASGRLLGTYSGALTLSNAANVFTGNGAGLTSLNAGNIISGTLADNRLSTNVALRNALNVFTASNSFNLSVGIGTTSPQSQLHVLGNGDTLALEGTTHTFIELYPDGFAAGRKGLLGFGGATDTFLTLRNEIIDGDIAFLMAGTGGVGIGTSAPLSRLDVVGAIRSAGTALDETMLYCRTTESGAPNDDGIRLRYDGDFLGGTTDAFVIEKTDSGSSPDGAIIFANTGSDNVVEPSMTIRGSGNIGIGTTAPNSRLQVVAAAGVGVWAESAGSGLGSVALRANNTNASGIGIFSTTGSSDANVVITNTGTGDLIRGFSGAGGGNLLFQVLNDGTTVTTVLQITGGSDLAEPFQVAAAGAADEPVKPGLVVVIDPRNPGQLKVADQPYDRKVAGIISGANGLAPGMVMTSKEHAITCGDQPVALSGRVWCHCDGAGTGIEPGDLLTTSAVAGHAIKAVDMARASGATIGKAMTPLKAGERGLVLVLVNLQ